MKRNLVWTVALTLGTLAAAARADNQLAVAVHGQQQSNWCWAGSGQMIMDYLGADVSQCDEANKAQGRADCCNTPTPAACNIGGWPPFSSYYFSSSNTSSTALSWAQLTREIDQGRPVAFSWLWTGGNGTGHMMVAKGYKTVGGVNWVTINDPEPVPTGSSYDITYSKYVTDASHSHWNDYYNITDQHTCMADFFGLPASSFQSCFNYQAQRDRYPVTLAEYNVSGSYYMTGSFQNVPSRPVATFMNTAQFSSLFTQYSQQGWRPAQVTAVSTAGGPVFTAIWAPIDGTFYSYINLTEQDLLARDNALRSSGFVAVDLFGYDSGGPRFAATWVQKSSAGYSLSTGLTGAQYSSLFTQMVGAGYQTTRFSAYPTASGTLYSALFQKQAGGFYHYYNLSASGFQADYNWLAGYGYRLSDVTSLGGVFSSIWVK